ncbi:hypothetical protein VULLAG_LOCUS23457 [Vulpes lagopus]
MAGLGLDPGTLSSGLRAVEQVVLSRATLGLGQVASGPSGKTMRKEAVAGGDAEAGGGRSRGDQGGHSGRPVGGGGAKGCPHPQGASDHALPESSAGTQHKARPQEPDTSLGFLSAPGSLLKRHHRQEAGSGMCHLGPPPVMWSAFSDADAVPLHDGRRASAARAQLGPA